MFKSVLGFSGIFFSISNSNRLLNPNGNYEMTLPNTASSYDFSMIMYKKKNETRMGMNFEMPSRQSSKHCRSDLFHNFMICDK